MYKRQGLGRVLPIAGKMAVILAAVVVMGLMFSALQAIGSVLLRDIISLAIVSGILLMCYSEGLTRGVTDVDASHAADKLEKEGKTLEKREEAACWQPMKAVLACLIVFGIPPVSYTHLDVYKRQRIRPDAGMPPERTSSMSAPPFGRGLMSWGFPTMCRGRIRTGFPIPACA